MNEELVNEPVLDSGREWPDRLRQEQGSGDCGGACAFFSACAMRMSQGWATLLSCSPTARRRAGNTIPSTSSNQQVQLAHIQTSLPIVLPAQVQDTEAILVGSKAAVHRFIQVDQAALNDEEGDHRFR